MRQRIIKFRRYISLCPEIGKGNFCPFFQFRTSVIFHVRFSGSILDLCKIRVHLTL